MRSSSPDPIKRDTPVIDRRTDRIASPFVVRAVQSPVPKEDASKFRISWDKPKDVVLHEELLPLPVGEFRLGFCSFNLDASEEKRAFCEYCASGSEDEARGMVPSSGVDGELEKLVARAGELAGDDEALEDLRSRTAIAVQEPLEKGVLTPAIEAARRLRGKWAMACLFGGPLDSMEEERGGGVTEPAPSPASLAPPAEREAGSARPPAPDRDARAIGQRRPTVEGAAPAAAAAGAAAAAAARGLRVKRALPLCPHGHVFHTECVVQQIAFYARELAAGRPINIECPYHCRTLCVRPRAASPRSELRHLIAAASAMSAPPPVSAEGPMRGGRGPLLPPPRGSREERAGAEALAHFASASAASDAELEASPRPAPSSGGDASTERPAAGRTCGGRSGGPPALQSPCGSRATWASSCSSSPSSSGPSSSRPRPAISSLATVALLVLAVVISERGR
eukprot:tig00000821_g4486.t1